MDLKTHSSPCNKNTPREEKITQRNSLTKVLNECLPSYPIDQISLSDGSTDEFKFHEENEFPKVVENRFIPEDSKDCKNEKIKESSNSSTTISTVDSHSIFRKDSSKVTSILDSLTKNRHKSSNQFQRTLSNNRTSQCDLNFMTAGTIKKPLTSQSASGYYDIHNFEFLKVAGKRHLLGSGAYGDVFLAKHKLDNTKYAIKVMNKAKLKSSNVKLSYIHKEIEVHSKLDHPFIINLKSFGETDTEVLMIMDYAKNGSLYTKIKKMQIGFSEESAFKYFIQTCSAVYFLQRNKFTHRDLKPENLLLDENNNIKLTDFGWCRSYNEKQPFKETCGTFEYMAPEIVLDKPYDEKVDNWALGILLYELLHGYPPFSIEANNYSKKNTKILMEKIIKNSIVYKEGLSEEVKDLMSCKF